MFSLGNANLLIVGSGFFGTTVARLAAEGGYQTVIIDRREHFGGNSYSYPDSETGIEIHQYGSHLFHTSNRRVWDFVNRFADFNSYSHRVYTTHENEIFSMPINLHTMSQLYKKALTPETARAQILRDSIIPVSGKPRNLEEKAIESVGRPLYEALIRGYTQKQWDRDPTELPASTIGRLPVRFNFNSRYFSDRWEGLPTLGYGHMFEQMLDHERIDFRPRTDFFDIRESIPAGFPVVYTGPLDEYFNFRFGRLSWRTLDFVFEKIDSNDFQGTSVMNFADPRQKYTRIHEFKHLHPERSVKENVTIIAREYSREVSDEKDEPYYPINTVQDRHILGLYRKLCERETATVFGGRLGTYQYLDMHMAIASAITKFETEISRLLKNAS